MRLAQWLLGNKHIDRSTSGIQTLQDSVDDGREEWAELQRFFCNHSAIQIGLREADNGYGKRRKVCVLNKANTT